MYFLDALKVLVRRRYIVLAGVILIVAAGVGAVKLVPTQYQASGQLLLLLPPESTGSKTPTNPYLNQPTGLTTTAALIAGEVSTKDTERQMVAAGFESDYALAVNPGTGPLIVITADDTDPEAAVATRDELIRRLDEELVQIQADAEVPARQLIYSSPSAVGQSAEPAPGAKIKALAVIVGVGMTATLVVAFMVDRFRSGPPGRGRTPEGTLEGGEARTNGIRGLTAAPGPVAETEDPPPSRPGGSVRGLHR